MKTILLSILITLFSYSISLAEFEDFFEAEYIANNYNDICFADSSTIFICGDYGAILKSSDSGITWKKCDTKTDVKKLNWFRAISSIENTTIAVGSYGLILISHDKGETWVIPDFAINESLTSIVLTDSETGVAFGYSGTIIKTTDAGLTWNKIQFENSNQIITSVLTKQKNILIATADGKVYKSIDKGDTWFEIAIPDTGLNFQNFSYSFDDKVYLLSKEKLLKSGDDSNTWISHTNPVDKSNRCTFTRDGKGFFTGSMVSSKIFVTENDTNVTSGESLDTLISYHSSSINKIIFWDDSLGFAIGAYNQIYKTTNGGKNWSQISFLGRKLGDFFGGMHFLNDSTGFLGDYKENVLKTTDAGVTWKLIPKGDNKFDYTKINQIYFWNENKGLMATSGLYSLLSTTDGLKTIKREYIQELNGASTYFTPIDDETYFLHGNRRFYDMEHFYLVYRDFNSRWWNKIELDSVYADVCNRNGQEFFLYGRFVDSVTMKKTAYFHTRGLLMHTLDSGKTFNKKLFDDINTIYELHFINKKEGFLFGSREELFDFEKPSIYKTTDGGETWFPIDSCYSNLQYLIGFLKDKYALGTGFGEFIYSQDINNSWEIIYIDTMFNARNIKSTNKYFFVSGRYGKGDSQFLLPQIMRIKLKDEFVSVEENEMGTESAPLCWIYEAYPNPAKNQVNFFVAWGSQFSFSEVEFNLYNLNGEKLTNPNYEYFPSTDNTGVMRLNTTGLPSGIYIIVMEVSAYKKAQKVIVY